MGGAGRQGSRATAPAGSASGLLSSACAPSGPLWACPRWSPRFQCGLPFPAQPGRTQRIARQHGPLTAAELMPGGPTATPRSAGRRHGPPQRAPAQRPMQSTVCTHQGMAVGVYVRQRRAQVRDGGAQAKERQRGAAGRQAGAGQGGQQQQRGARHRVAPEVDTLVSKRHIGGRKESCFGRHIGDARGTRVGARDAVPQQERCGRQGAAAARALQRGQRRGGGGGGGGSPVVEDAVPPGGVREAAGGRARGPAVVQEQGTERFTGSCFYQLHNAPDGAWGHACWSASRGSTCGWAVACWVPLLRQRIATGRRACTSSGGRWLGREAPSSAVPAWGVGEAR